MRIQTLKGERRGASDLVATVLIIAATLIAFAAVAGYVFGILGSGSNTANVAVTSASINHTMLTGVLTLSNTGTGGTSATGVTLTYKGATCNPVSSTAIVGSGATVAISITGLGNCAATGSSSPYMGYVSMGNGEEATFAGLFT
jgi:hypothetical protein